MKIKNGSIITLLRNQAEIKLDKEEILYWVTKTRAHSRNITKVDILSGFFCCESVSNSKQEESEGQAKPTEVRTPSNMHVANSSLIIC